MTTGRYRSARQRRAAARRRRAMALTALLVAAGIVAVLVLRRPSAAPPHRTAGTGAAAVPQPRGGKRSHGRGGRSAVARTAQDGIWRIAWGSAMAWAQPGVEVDDATIRELATVALGGRAVRIRISNLFGNAPLVVKRATVAKSAGAADIVPGTVSELTFHGQPGVTIPPGKVALSDPVHMGVAGGQTLAASVFVGAADLVTVHPYGNAGSVSFATTNGSGDFTGSTGGGGFAYASEWPRLVDAVDVLERRGRGSVVVLGDSITDGFNTTVRWTDLLQKRIDKLPVSERRAIINEGITANALNSIPGDYSRVGGGPAGLRRLSSDVLDQPGVSYLVLFLGTNDLFFGDSATQVISGMKEVIRRAHAAGIKVVGVTLLPRQGSERWNPAQYPTHQPYLDAIDHWIRTSHAFDGVIDMARAVADIYNGQCQGVAMFPAYDSGDHLHPDAAGQTVMANAVDTRLLGMPPAPLLPPLVPATPTPGCTAS